MWKKNVWNRSENVKVCGKKALFLAKKPRKKRKKPYICGRFFFVVVSFLQILFLLASGAEATQRIETITMNRSEIFHLEMVPGLGTFMRFPCDIERALAGDDRTVHILLTKPYDRELLVSVLSTKMATNLIVTCVNNPYPFVFDIHPNMEKHRDVLVISRQSGGIKTLFDPEKKSETQKNPRSFSIKNTDSASMKGTDRVLKLQKIRSDVSALVPTTVSNEGGQVL